MLQLTYISSAAPGVPAGVLEEVLLVSRRRNLMAGVTGLLLFDGRRFLQALEGDEAEVRTVFERIRRDPRHRALVLLSSREVATRNFGEWSMASRVAAPGAEEAGVADAIESLTSCIADPAQRELFRDLAGGERKAV